MKEQVNKFNPKKLTLSKWTAVNPKNKERHFIITELVKDQEDEILGCIMEAVINKNSYHIDWMELKHTDSWLMGWK